MVTQVDGPQGDATGRTRRRGRLGHVALALTICVARPCPALGQDAPTASTPDQDAAVAAALAATAKLNTQLTELYRAGDVAAAIPLAREVVALREKALGKDHLAVAMSLSNLALFLAKTRSFVEARAVFERILDIRERALGPDDILTGATVSSLGVLRYLQGDFRGARPLLERALRLRETRLGPDHLDVAESLNQLAMALKAQGLNAAARPLYERALAIRERELGGQHPKVAESLNNLGVLLDDLGEYDAAKARFDRALEIDEAVLDADDPQLATTLSNLAVLLDEQGDGARARPLHERALAIREGALGRDHPDVAASLSNLAVSLAEQGAIAEARPLQARALAIWEQALGPDHPDVAGGQCNLGRLIASDGSPGEGRVLLERALQTWERSLGGDHPHVATCLNNLAHLLVAEGENAKALPLLERALAISETAFGRDALPVATVLNNVAVLLRDAGALARARQLQERSLRIWEDALSKNHPDVAFCLVNLARLAEGQGALAEARPLYERALVMTEAHARGQLSALTTRQRLGLLRSTRFTLDDWVRLAPRVGRSGYPEVLRLRGLVSRAEAAERVVSRRAGAADRRRLEALTEAERRVTHLANAIPASREPDVRGAWQKAYAAAAAERERRTLELAQHLAPLRIALDRLELALGDIQAQLQPDEALVDLLRSDDHYFAWIVRATGEPVRVDVGRADRIEAACGEFLSSITSDLDDPAAGATLRTVAWGPIEARLGDGVRRIVICPDAALAAIPFAALPGRAAGRALLDDYAISYVMQPQDLVPSRDVGPRGTGAVVVGGVDYDHADVEPTPGPRAAGPPPRGDATRAPRGGEFVPIPGTKAEAERLAERFGAARTALLRGPAATESRLRVATSGTRFVHIATHGFAREDLLAGLYARRIDETFTSAGMERQLAVGHDPMLLSGLALAGANPRAGGGGDDGILTALEASYLDLDGVELVTLSACETARGTVESGEGVQGLVSAFQMAGARRVIASLWRVDDEATRQLMEGVYERILRQDRPLPPADALGAAALALRSWKNAAWGGAVRGAAVLGGVRRVRAMKPLPRTSESAWRREPEPTTTTMNSSAAATLAELGVSGQRRRPRVRGGRQSRQGGRGPGPPRAGPRVRSGRGPGRAGSCCRRASRDARPWADDRALRRRGVRSARRTRWGSSTPAARRWRRGSRRGAAPARAWGS